MAKDSCSNTTGTDNTASGSYALFSDTGGSYNTAAGYAALYSNTTGTDNTQLQAIYRLVGAKQLARERKSCARCSASYPIRRGSLRRVGVVPRLVGRSQWAGETAAGGADCGAQFFGPSG